MLGGGQGGEGAGTLDGTHHAEGFGGDAEDRAEGEQAAVLVHDHGAVEAGDRFQYGGLEVAKRGAPDRVMEGPLGQPGREVLGILGVGGGNLLGHPIVRSDQLLDGPGGISGDHEEGAGACLAEVERGLEEAEGEVGGVVRPTASRQAAKLLGMSCIRHRASLKLKSMVPPEKTLISWLGETGPGRRGRRRRRPGVAEVGARTGMFRRLESRGPWSAQPAMSTIRKRLPSDRP